MTSSKGGVLIVPIVAALLGLHTPARADDAAVRRLATALAAIDDAPEPLGALIAELRGLEGLRLTGDDAPALRQALGGGHPAIAPLAGALRGMSVQGGVVRMTLERPVVVALRRGVISLATDVALTVRSGPQGDLTVDDTRGFRAGRSASVTLEVRRLRVATEGLRRVGHADLALGFVKTAVTFDVGPATGLVGAVGGATP